MSGSVHVAGGQRVEVDFVRQGIGSYSVWVGSSLLGHVRRRDSRWVSIYPGDVPAGEGRTREFASEPLVARWLRSRRLDEEVVPGG